MVSVAFSNFIEIIHDGIDIQHVKDLSSSDISPGGMTALYDAMGGCISRMEKVPVAAYDDVAYLFTVFTDGQENASSKITRNMLKEKMAELDRLDNWTCVFMGSDQGAVLDARDLGTHHFMSFAADKSGVSAAYVSNTEGIESFMRSRSSGVKSIKTYGGYFKESTTDG